MPTPALAPEFIWIFNGDRARFPSGVFTEFTTAADWIKANSLSGILTKYPINQGIYDWALANQLFKIKSEHQKTAQFIQTFSSASMEHHHFANGTCETNS